MVSGITISVKSQLTPVADPLDSTASVLYYSLPPLPTVLASQ